MPAFILRTSPEGEAACPGARVLAFGHLGDGNVHFNVRPPLGDGGEWLGRHIDAINRFVHDAVTAMGGTLSAEHGIGVRSATSSPGWPLLVSLSGCGPSSRRWTPRDSITRRSEERRVGKECVG